MVTDAIRTPLLQAEVENEPQWIVWPDAEEEAAWAAEELARELRAAQQLAIRSV